MNLSSPYSPPPPTPTGPPLQYVPPRSGRPIGVTVFAILNVLFGVAGVFGTLGSAAMLFVGGMFGNNPVANALQTNPAYRYFFIASLVLGLIFVVILVVSGIGLFQMSKTARKLAIAYGVYAIIASIVTNTVNVFLVFMPMLEQAGAQQPMMLAGIGGAVIGGLIGLIYPVALLVYFLQPSVKRQFEVWESPTSESGLAQRPHERPHADAF